MASISRPPCRHLEQLLRFFEDNVHKLPSQCDVRQAAREYDVIVSEVTKLNREKANTGVAWNSGSDVTTTASSRQDLVGQQTTSEKSTTTEPSRTADTESSHGGVATRGAPVRRETEESANKRPEVEDERRRGFDDMQDTIKLQQIKIRELTNRLSAYASKQMMEGNPDIVDLSDANRPTKLAERFSELYDNEWSDAFEPIKSVRDEMTTIAILLKVVMRAYTFCTEMAEYQLTRLVGQLDSVLEKTERKDRDTTFTCMVTFGKKDKQRHMTASRKFAKEYMRAFGNEVSKSIQELFLNIEGPKIFQVENRTKLPLSIQTYVTTCADIVWLMVIQDPPLTLVLAELGDKLNRAVFNGYMRKGTTVKRPVWPAVYLHDGGPLISKGYAYPE